MTHEILKWTYKGMECRVVLIDYEVVVIENHHCGYATTSIELTEKQTCSIDVPNGVTHESKTEEGLFVYGFHCGAYGDTLEEFTVARVRTDLDNMVNQILEMQ